jgi:hypothetical protein
LNYQGAIGKTSATALPKLLLLLLFLLNSSYGFETQANETNKLKTKYGARDLNSKESLVDYNSMYRSGLYYDCEDY